MSDYHLAFTERGLVRMERTAERLTTLDRIRSRVNRLAEEEDHPEDYLWAVRGIR